MHSLNALLAAAEWLATDPDSRLGKLPAGQRSRYIARCHFVSRRALDAAINDVRNGLAHPSQVFHDTCYAAERLSGQPLNTETIKKIVQNLWEAERDGSGLRLQGKRIVLWRREAVELELI